MRGFHVSLSCASKYRYLEFKCCSAALFPDNERSDCILFFPLEAKALQGGLFELDTFSHDESNSKKKKGALLKVDFLLSPSQPLTSISFSPFLLCCSLSHIHNAAPSFFFFLLFLLRVFCFPIFAHAAVHHVKHTHTHKYTRHEKKVEA